jgi:hypothetical protein
MAQSAGTVEPLITDTVGGNSNFVRYRRCTLVAVCLAFTEAIRGIGFSFFIGGVR